MFSFVTGLASGWIVIQFNDADLYDLSTKCFCPKKLLQSDMKLSRVILGRGNEFPKLTYGVGLTYFGQACSTT